MNASVGTVRFLCQPTCYIIVVFIPDIRSRRRHSRVCTRLGDEFSVEREGKRERESLGELIDFDVCSSSLVRSLIRFIAVLSEWNAPIAASCIILPFRSSVVRSSLFFNSLVSVNFLCSLCSCSRICADGS